MWSWRACVLDPRLAPALVAGVSAAVLATVYLSQYWGGLQPCELCLYQRWPWWAALGAGIAGRVLARDARLARIAVATAAITLAAGAVLASFHLGVEQGWWEGPAACSGSGTPSTLDAMRAEASQAAAVPCNQAAWSLWGVSMAGLNALVSAAGAAAALTAAVFMRHSASHPSGEGA